MSAVWVDQWTVHTTVLFQSTHISAPLYILQNELAIYKRDNGHCYVPQRYKDNPPLGNFCDKQRAFFKAGKLSAERIGKLNELGFEWALRASRKKKREDTKWISPITLSRKNHFMWEKLILCSEYYKSKTSSHTTKNENLRNSRQFLGHYRTIETASSNQTKSCVASKRSFPVGLPPWTSSEVRSRPRSNASKLGDLVEIRADFFLLGFHTTLALYA